MERIAIIEQFRMLGLRSQPHARIRQFLNVVKNFASSTDWAPWSTSGIITQLIPRMLNDGNDKCAYINQGATQYSLTKQSSIDLSSCVSGAYLNFSHIKESGNLKAEDCVFVSISNDGGITWSANNQIFCSNLASIITYNLSIPPEYFTADFKVRITKTGFSPAASKKAWIDGLSISCNNIVQNCSGTCNNCPSYSNESSCSSCGCNWNETSWNWLPADLSKDTYRISNARGIGWVHHKQHNFARHGLFLFRNAK